VVSRAPQCALTTFNTLEVRVGVVSFQARDAPNFREAPLVTRTHPANRPYRVASGGAQTAFARAGRVCTKTFGGIGSARVAARLRESVELQLKHSRMFETLGSSRRKECAVVRAAGTGKTACSARRGPAQPRPLHHQKARDVHAESLSASAGRVRERSFVGGFGLMVLRVPRVSPAILLIGFGEI